MNLLLTTNPMTQQREITIQLINSMNNQTQLQINAGILNLQTMILTKIVIPIIVIVISSMNKIETMTEGIKGVIKTIMHLSQM